MVVSGTGRALRRQELGEVPEPACRWLTAQTSSPHEDADPLGGGVLGDTPQLLQLLQGAPLTAERDARRPLVILGLVVSRLHDAIPGLHGLVVEVDDLRVGDAAFK